jgi:hypothetical protein
MNEFGVNRWICELCGNFYDIDIRFSHQCFSCNFKRMKVIVAKKMKARLDRGEKIKSWSTRARKAVETRLVNMYSRDRDKFDVAITRLIARDGNKRRANRVMRKIGEVNGK